MSYRLIDANALIGEISYEDYEKVQNAPCIYADLPNEMDDGMYLAIPSHEGMTNGDMIKAMFPSVEVKEKNNGYAVYFGIGTAIQFFNHKWWNAPYNMVRKTCGSCEHFNGEHACCKKGQFVNWNCSNEPTKCPDWEKGD